MSKMKDTRKDREGHGKMGETDREAGEELEMNGGHVHQGCTPEELYRMCQNQFVNKQNAIPACLGCRGFPKSVCTSVNNVICHGIPSEKKVLKKGDILNIDVTVIKDGWHGDTSKMYYVGEPSVLS